MDRRGTIFDLANEMTFCAPTADDGRPKATIDRLPDKVLFLAFSFLPHRDVLKCSQVSRRWRTIACDSRLWQDLSFRPEYGGMRVANMDILCALIGIRFGPSLKLIELPMELIQIPVIVELTNKCPKLQYLTLDFSNAMQLPDYNDLQTFPARLRSLTICLSEVIFLEGFMRKIYSFISSIQVLHLIGTYEKIEDEQSEVYEVINIFKVKQYVPNLTVVNLFGVVFLTDEHIEAISSNCAQLACLAVNYCQKVKGASLRTLLARCRKLKCLLMGHALLDSKHFVAAKWEDSNIQELNIAATELTSDALISALNRLSNLRWLSAGFLEQFNDQVMQAWMDSGAPKNLIAISLDTCDNLSERVVSDFLTRYGQQLVGLNLGGIPQFGEQFWVASIRKLRNVKLLVMGIAIDCCPKVRGKIPIDQFVDYISHHCHNMERLELRWDAETLRFSDKSSKFIDTLRMKCLRLHSLVLSDGQFFEMVRSNFERADRFTTVRTTNTCRVSLVRLLAYYNDLLFN